MQSETALRLPALAMQLSNVVKTFARLHMTYAAQQVRGMVR